MDGVEHGCYLVGMQGKQSSSETPPKFTSFGGDLRSHGTNRNAEGVLY